MAYEGNETRGNLKISESVISTICSTAASEVIGVDTLTPVPGIMGGLKLNNQAQGVDVKLLGGTVRITVYLSVLPGRNIPEICTKVQDAVKSAVQSMCKTVVEKVDVYVTGVKAED